MSMWQPGLGNGAHAGEVEKEMGLWQAVKKTLKYATRACT